MMFSMVLERIYTQLNDYMDLLDCHGTQRQFLFGASVIVSAVAVGLENLCLIVIALMNMPCFHRPPISMPSVICQRH